MQLWIQEWKQNRKSFLVWSILVGLFCLLCLLMYDSMGDKVQEMSGMFSELGDFSVALGMDKISIGTLQGYYAIEISLIFSLGGAMYAAFLGSSLVAKEEEGHTGEFLVTLPLGRGRIIFEKYLSMISLFAAFHVIGLLFIRLGFAWMGETVQENYFWTYHLFAFLMNLEIGSICFCASAFLKKKPVGAVMCAAVLFYVADILCRVVPALEFLKFLTPFYYCNATDIFSGESVKLLYPVLSLIITVISFVSADLVYTKRDLAA